jgi:hypothetical protein
LRFRLMRINEISRYFVSPKPLLLTVTLGADP